MNTCTPTERRMRENNNAKSGTKKKTMKTMTTKNTKTRRKSGTRYLIGTSLKTLHCP